MSKEEEIPQIIIEDLLCRFLINLPEEEQSSNRLFFHIQSAFWFYSDFYVGNKEIMNAGFQVPPYNWRSFARLMYKYCPYLKNYLDCFDLFFNRFTKYISQIPTFGALILNETLDKILLVTNFKNTFYGFPKGKINQNESGIECAIREVWEETGINVSQHISEKDFIECKIEGNRIQKMYVVHGIDENVYRKAHCRGEIGRIEWVPLAQIQEGKNQNKMFQRIITFISPLKVWIRNYFSEKEREKKNGFTPGAAIISSNIEVTAPISEPEPVPLHFSEEQKLSYEKFTATLKRIGQDFERKLIEEETPEKEIEIINPFLSFKLDSSSLRAAFSV